MCAVGRGDQACFLWEGNDLGQDRVMTYKEVLEEVCQLVRQAQGCRQGSLTNTQLCKQEGEMQ